jgi:hypothetical protein
MLSDSIHFAFHCDFFFNNVSEMRACSLYCIQAVKQIIECDSNYTLKNNIAHSLERCHNLFLTYLCLFLFVLIQKVITEKVKVFVCY